MQVYLLPYTAITKALSTGSIVAQISLLPPSAMSACIDYQQPKFTLYKVIVQNYRVSLGTAPAITCSSLAIPCCSLEVNNLLKGLGVYKPLVYY